MNILILIMSSNNECCICLENCKIIDIIIICDTCNILIHLECIVKMTKLTYNYNKCPQCRNSLDNIIDKTIEEFEKNKPKHKFLVDENLSKNMILKYTKEIKQNIKNLQVILNYKENLLIVYKK